MKPATGQAPMMTNGRVTQNEKPAKTISKR